MGGRRAATGRGSGAPAEAGGGIWGRWDTPPVLSSWEAPFPRRTCVNADAQAQLLLGPVTDAEGAHGVQQRQGHAGHLAGVQPPVPHGEPRHHHVGVADGLHLGGRRGGAGHEGWNCPSLGRPNTSCTVILSPHLPAAVCPRLPSLHLLLGLPKTPSWPMSPCPRVSSLIKDAISCRPPPLSGPLRESVCPFSSLLPRSPPCTRRSCL